MNHPKLIFRATGFTLRKGLVGVGEPTKGRGALDLSFCQHEGDEADENSLTGFELFLKLPVQWI